MNKFVSALASAARRAYETVFPGAVWRRIAAEYTLSGPGFFTGAGHKSPGFLKIDVDRLAEVFQQVGETSGVFVVSDSGIMKVLSYCFGPNLSLEPMPGTTTVRSCDDCRRGNYKVLDIDTSAKTAVLDMACPYRSAATG